ncbi:hypothetical protein TNCV_764141 [Trichonephila clavipes]|nr:hypothetical protein TNCV_764141 [Trichonephila clavipes]
MWSSGSTGWLVAAFARSSATSFPDRPTREGTHCRWIGADLKAVGKDVEYFCWCCRRYMANLINVGWRIGCLSGSKFSENFDL